MAGMKTAMAPSAIAKMPGAGAGHFAFSADAVRRSAMVVVVMAVMVPVVPIVRAVDWSGRRRLLVLGVALVHAEHAFHAPDHTTDRAPDDGAERTGNAVAFVKAVGGATRNAAGRLLRLGRERHGEGREAGGNKQFHFHVVSLISAGSLTRAPMTAQQGHSVA
jgi:hypothetical protein